MTENEVIERLRLLRRPFEKHQISKLPKPLKKDAQKGRCDECGGWHGLPAVHLDYVGHAALTDRLLEVDPAWTWEPMALTPDGLPLFDSTGGLWIRLTVCGVARLGYGHAESKSDPGAREKEVIGDALRNAAMRFGAALDLWHKGQLHGDDEDEPKAVDAKTGEEVPLSKAAAPDGFHYVTNYRFANGWHNAVVLKYGADGSPMKVSTKKQQIGTLLERFCSEMVPVKVQLKAKPNATGEAYLDSINAYETAKVLETARELPTPEVMLDADAIPF